MYQTLVAGVPDTLENQTLVGEDDATLHVLVQPLTLAKQRYIRTTQDK